MASASKRPEGSTDRPKNDGHLRYIEVTEAFNTRLAEFATRRALAQENDARISTARDHWRQRMSIEDDQAEVERANNETRKRATNLERCTKRIGKVMKELETNRSERVRMRFLDRKASVLVDV
jgi:chromosome segregation ATPase